MIDSAKWIRERERKTLVLVLPLMMGCRHHGAPVQEDLDDLVVVGVGGQDERGDVGGEGGRVAVQSLQNRLWCTVQMYSLPHLPAPQVALLVDALLVVQ